MYKYCYSNEGAIYAKGLLGSERLPALSTMFVRLPSLCLGVCLLCTRFSTHFSSLNSVVIVCAEDIVCI